MLQVKVKNIYEIEYEDIPEPILNPNEAIIKIASVGICGSDIHVFKGENPVLKPPVVQGHEFGGVIESIKGKGGRNNFKIGQKVTVFPTINCGKCFYCKKDLSHLCETQKIFDGGSLDGAMKEKIAVFQEPTEEETLKRKRYLSELNLFLRRWRLSQNLNQFQKRR